MESRQHRGHWGEDRGGGDGWNSDSLTYQGWKISGPPWPSAWGVAGMGGGGPEKMNKPGEAMNSA